ncbi:MAG: TIGR02556 family CRISPR-associated protein [Candidatus Margulisbacteria bacterium]|nr:TIGR02556 family CRISPR-associated protein [Candidatus Margulisiibacteriota bacterium]
MLKKLYKLGKYIPEEYFEDNPLGLNMSHTGGMVCVIQFSFNNDVFLYDKITYEDYDAARNEYRYLFEELDSPNSTPAFPTYRVNKAGDKSIKEKTISALSKIKNSLNCYERLKQITNCIDANIEELVLDISEKVDYKESFLITLMINGQYLAEIDEVKNKVVNRTSEIYAKYYSNDKKYVGEQAVCSLCMLKKDEVWGYVSPYNFYAVKTEQSVVSGGFNVKNAWKNFPVCEDCAKKILKYKTAIKQRLSFNFYGFNYFLIPEVVLDKGNNKEFVDVLFNDQYGLLNLRKLKETNKLEDDLVDILKETNNSANFTLLFYEENNAEFKIVLSIDDVFPSRFNSIFSAREYSENNLLFKDLTFKDGIKDLKMSFGVIKHFFPSSKIEGDFSSYFLEIVRSIFIVKKVDYDFVINRIITKLRNKFVNEEYLFVDLLNSMLLIRFMNHLKLWNKKESIKEREVVMDSNKYNIFLDEHKEFFDNNTKKAIFLEGVLCQFLFNIQYSERNSTPFKSKLNGLKLDEKYIKKLLPEIINKLEEYDKNYYKDLETIISKYMLESTFDMTNDEISFYFVMGMNLAKEFRNEKEKNEEVN